MNWHSEPGTRRTAVSALLAATVLALTAQVRPDLGNLKALRGLEPGVFWDEKLRLPAQYDLLVAGDSRVYRGVVPEVLEAALGGQAANLGFSGLGYEERYCDYVQGLLRPDGRRIVILSITPSSLTSRSARENGFLDAVGHRPRWGAAARWLNGPFHRRFEPFTYFEILEMLGLRAQQFVYFEDYRATGWVASDQQPRDPTRAGPSYREFFHGNPVDARVSKALLERVRRWAGAGIRVVALRMPIGTSLHQIEREESGMDWDGFRSAFQAAGGKWLGDFSADPAFPTYDGSHLTANSAEAFSRAVAAAISPGPGG